MCKQYRDAPLVEQSAPPSQEGGPKVRTPGDSGDGADIDELMRGMKGIPGMENLKMFTADDIKGMNTEQMAGAFSGGKPKQKTRSQWRRELVDFYTKYGLEDKLDGVDAALDKWKGRENKMFGVLYKKYDESIRAADKQEL